ncbi:MAG: hypothetical protein WCJ58_07180 [bacterium]
MLKNNIDKQKLIKNLLAVAPKHCDNCGNKYEENDFKIVKNSPVSTVIHLKCSKCNNSYMLNVLNPVDGMIGAQRTPVNVDLEHGDEIQKFAGLSGVTRDEAIDVHKQLSADLTKEKLQKLFN